MDGVWGLDIVQTEEGIVGSSNHGDPCDNSLLTTGRGDRGGLNHGKPLICPFMLKLLI
ncbi:hypothetical protein LguiA_008577 [Lonicera macranthoides]